MDKSVLRNITYGMYVIGSKMDNRNVGMIANTVVQITSSPATIAVSCNKDNYTYEAIKSSKVFSVSILGETIDPKIIGTFGYSSSRDKDKYEGIDVTTVEDMPLISSAIGGMVCKLVSEIDVGTHTIFIGEVTSAVSLSKGLPMTYKYYHEVLKGKSPKNAPTYVEDIKDTDTNGKKIIWKCSVCGYEVEMDELPSDFVCPMCGQPASVFERIER